MSRHRAIRNLDLDDYLDDECDDDQLDDNSTVQDNETMEACLAKVRQLLDHSTEITDSEIRETLWYYYFDIDQTVSWLLDKHGRDKPEPLERGKGKSGKSGKSASTKGNLNAMLDSSRISSPGSPFKSLPKPAENSVRACGQWGLLGGSSKMSKEPAKQKPSKLAALARSSRGAFEKKLDANRVSAAGINLGSVARLSSLSSRPPPPGVPVLAQTSSKDPTDSTKVDELSLEAMSLRQSERSIDPCSDNLLAPPSFFALSLFCSYVVPRGAAESLLKFYTNPLLLTGTGEAQLIKAFSTASPDDVTENALLRDKGARAEQKKVETNQFQITQLTTDVQHVNIDETTGFHYPSVKTSQSRKQTLAEIKAEVLSQKDSSVSFVIIGHVDAGKSTLMGRLLYELHAIDERTVQKYRQESQKAGKGSFALAWIMDQSEEERKRGVTIDVASQAFSTPTRSFHVLDAPGHRDFIPNMIAGATQADFGLLVLDASPGGFESGFAPLGQTKEHALLVRSLGVQKLVVAVNKLDTVKWSERRFNEIMTQTRQFLSQAGYGAANLYFIPCSGLTGVNLISRRDEKELAWYSGPTLLECLESVDVPKRSLDLPLRLSINDISKTSKTNVVTVTGKIESGILQLGDDIISEPGDYKGTVRSLNTQRESTYSVAGDVATLTINGFEESMLRAGDIICQVDEPIPVCTVFFARVITFEVGRPLVQGSSIVVHRGRIDEPARIKQIESLIDKGDGHVVKKRPRHIPQGAAAIVCIELTNKRGLPLEPFNINRNMGRVIIRSEGVTVAAGIVTSCGNIVAIE